MHMEVCKDGAHVGKKQLKFWKSKKRKEEEEDEERKKKEKNSEA